MAGNTYPALVITAPPTSNTNPVDVALSTSYGATRLNTMTVWADEVAADEPGGPPPEEDADALDAAEQGPRGAEADAESGATARNARLGF